jgi:hypothetical protein
MIVLTVMSLDKVSVLGLVIARVIMIVLTVMSLDKVSVLGLVIVRTIPTLYQKILLSKQPL